MKRNRMSVEEFEEKEEGERFAIRLDFSLLKILLAGQGGWGHTEIGLVVIGPRRADLIAVIHIRIPDVRRVVPVRVRPIVCVDDIRAVIVRVQANAAFINVGGVPIRKGS